MSRRDDDPNVTWPVDGPPGPSGLPEATAHDYEDLGAIGQGGMGEVRRVRDRALGRVMAMKVIRADHLKRARVLSRFVEEAQATAQLEHPGIVPVHALGRLQDGRVFFTMKEVRGKTLGDAIDEAHNALVGGPPSEWNLRRLVEAFRRVCDAVGYAHARGVIHRDLKPDNVMVGAFGEVLVVDWGLAKIVGTASPIPDLPPVETARSRSGTTTKEGTVAGTPAYMPPEQARGEIERLGPPADVWSLGAVLYEILAGVPPYGPHHDKAVNGVMAGQPPALAEVAPGKTLPHELVQTVLKAMSRRPEDRHPDGGALAAEIGAWLEGARKRDTALSLVSRARGRLPEVQAMRARAIGLRAEAKFALEGVGAWEPVDKKRRGWEKEDEAARLETEADLGQLEVTELLRSALMEVPDLPEARAMLADHYRDRLADAESRRDARAAAKFEVQLRAHDDGRYARWLQGDGLLSLRTEPADAIVEVHRYVERERRLVPVLDRVLRAPVVEAPLPRGSWLLVVRAPKRQAVRLPVYVRRGEHVDFVRPGATAPSVLSLPAEGELGPDDVLVAAGWTQVGGDAQVPLSLPSRRIWVDGFVLRRFPVTNREYLAFLHDLLAQGREADALRHAPREASGMPGVAGALLYGRDAEGRFFLKPDTEGDLWLPDWPAINVDWAGASAYAAWEAERTGLPWRLPFEIEWEKAARGADGRCFPWGDFLDPTWACVRESFPKTPSLDVVTSFPGDESPYGVRGLAGGVRDWCADAWRADGPPLRADGTPDVDVVEEEAPLRSQRGGSWTSSSMIARSAGRAWMPATYRTAQYGFRLARPAPIGR